ncbi:hypothetical protein N806_29720 [Rhodococcus sp. P27]|nr:hypothetical protein N806_29720 [Rhodococcus sp. P27]
MSKELVLDDALTGQVVSDNYIEYNSNNSGGSWWLTDEDWYALERAGWDVQWFKNNDYYSSERFLGGLASSARLYEATMEEAIESFESITGENVSAQGCECCGSPHSFWEATASE